MRRLLETGMERIGGFYRKPEGRVYQVSAGSRSPSSLSNVESAAPYKQSIQSFVGQPNIESLGSFQSMKH